MEQQDLTLIVLFWWHSFKMGQDNDFLPSSAIYVATCIDTKVV